LEIEETRRQYIDYQPHNLPNDDVYSSFFTEQHNSTSALYNTLTMNDGKFNHTMANMDRILACSAHIELMLLSDLRPLSFLERFCPTCSHHIGGASYYCCQRSHQDEALRSVQTHSQVLMERKAKRFVFLIDTNA
jgi:hypothetical protein